MNLINIFQNFVNQKKKKSIQRNLIILKRNNKINYQDGEINFFLINNK